MMTRPIVYRFLFGLLFSAASCSQALADASAGRTAPAPEWVRQSDALSMRLLNAIATFSPVEVAADGVEGDDGEIADLTPGHRERADAKLSAIAQEFRVSQLKEQDPRLREDITILLRYLADRLRQNALKHQYELSYTNVAGEAYQDIRQLLDDQIKPARRVAAVERLKRIAGLWPATQAMTVLAENESRADFSRPGLRGPTRAAVEKNIRDGQTYYGEIGSLFKQYHLHGYEAAYEALGTELSSYSTFVKTEIVPRSAADFRLPPEEYAFALHAAGVDRDPAALSREAHAAFVDLQQQLQKLAPEVVAATHLTLPKDAKGDYRAVLASLKAQQITGDAILPLYKQRLADIETMIEREHLVTLPRRPLRIRIATASETAQVPAPHYDPPRLIGNTGEQGEFVLPLNVPPPPGPRQATASRYDDFTWDGIAWALTAHEGRPGHDLQFSGMVENGISIARARFALNSANVEGWALYCEGLMLPYEPVVGQFGSLQLRILRAARAFLDPDLQAGRVTREQAMTILTHDVGLSAPMANSEVERYTFNNPGQATAYFVGYTSLLVLYQNAERQLGSNFNRQDFHDFILKQGALPLDLMAQAVKAHYKLS